MRRFAPTFCSGMLLAMATMAGGKAFADGVGLAYDPAVGSAWIITSEERDEKTIAGKTTAHGNIRKEEFSVIEKTADGFRVDFVLRSYETSGDDVEGPAGMALYGPVKDKIIHATLDASGKPVRIENLVEIRDAFKQGLDRMLEVVANPESREKLRTTLVASLLDMVQDPRQAAEALLDHFSLFALAQNTGLSLGEERRTAEQSPNPFGGDPVKVTSVLHLAEADPAGEKLRYVQTDVYDPAEMKAMALAIERRLGLTQGSSGADLEKVMKELSLSMDGGAEFRVERGMTRLVNEDLNISLSAQGQTLTKHDHTTTTLAPK